MRVGLVILPTDRWREARRQWEWADRAGFCTAWTYDHIRWGGMPDGPVARRRARAGRGGQRDVAGQPRHAGGHAELPASGDAGPRRAGTRRHQRRSFRPRRRPGQRGFRRRARSARNPGARPHRLDRFAQFLEVLSPIIEGDATARHTARTEHYAAAEAPSTPGRAAAPIPTHGRRRRRQGHGARGALRAAVGDHRPDGARRAHRGDDPSRGAHPAPRWSRPRAQLPAGTSATVGKVLLWMPAEPTIDSAEQFEELAAPYAALGFDQIVLHHPDQTGPFGGSVAAFEEIAARHAGCVSEHGRAATAQSRAFERADRLHQLGASVEPARIRSTTTRSLADPVAASARARATGSTDSGPSRRA